jgi:hypothetical protein
VSAPHSRQCPRCRYLTDCWPVFGPPATPLTPVWLPRSDIGRVETRTAGHQMQCDLPFCGRGSPDLNRPPLRLKPSSDAACHGVGMHDLGGIVRQCSPVSAAGGESIRPGHLCRLEAPLLPGDAGRGQLRRLGAGDPLARGQQADGQVAGGRPRPRLPRPDGGLAAGSQRVLGRSEPRTRTGAEIRLADIR